MLMHRQIAPAGEGSVNFNEGNGHILQSKSSGFGQSLLHGRPALVEAHILMDDLHVMPRLDPFAADVMAHACLLVVVAVTGVQSGDEQNIHACFLPWLLYYTKISLRTYF